MIKLIHGGNNLRSFQALAKITKVYDEFSVTRLSGSDLNISNIREAVETPSFSGQRLLLIEDLSGNRNQTLVPELKKYLPSLPSTATVVIYERRQLPPESALLKLTKDIEVYPAARGLNVFTWADSVGSRKLHESLSGWDKLIQSGEDPEYLFLMLVRQFRLLVLISCNEKPAVPDFVAMKLATQARQWPAADLAKIYRQLTVLDRHHKTGQQSLTVSIPALLASIAR